MNRKHYFLIGFSLIFLAVFLGLYLHKSYLEAQEGLKNELEVSLNKVNQEIKEGQLKEIFFFIRDTVETADHFDTDSFAFTTKMQNRIVEENHYSGNISVMVVKDSIDPLHDHSNIYIKNKSDSIQVNELLFSTGELESLDSLWKLKLLESDLPYEYYISKVGENYAPDSLYINIKDQDFFNSDRYVATFSNHQRFILKKITPQIFFSILLLTMVGAAFYFSVKSLHEQEKIGQLKNDFISNMTHELKTPISTVGVAIEAMQNFDVLSSPNRTNEYLNIASNELSRLSILVDKVLKMSQFESAGAPLGKVTISDFDEIIKNVSESMQIQFEKYNATLELNIPDGNYQVEGDKVHLANIIYNLMDNALKYSKEDPKIQILLLEKSEDIILKITDNGIGIPKEYQSKIFDQFFRVPTGNVHNIKGYGLGLNYVSKVVKAHGGKINLRSKESKGTEFTIELPKYV